MQSTKFQVHHDLLRSYDTNVLVVNPQCMLFVVKQMMKKVMEHLFCLFRVQMNKQFKPRELMQLNVQAKRIFKRRPALCVMFSYLFHMLIERR